MNLPKFHRKTLSLKLCPYRYMIFLSILIGVTFEASTISRAFNFSMTSILTLMAEDSHRRRYMERNSVCKYVSSGVPLFNVRTVYFILIHYDMITKV